MGSREERAGELELQLETEAAQHQDILREQYIDSYANLTIKSISGFKWAVNKCPKVNQTEYHCKNADQLYMYRFVYKLFIILFSVA